MALFLKAKLKINLVIRKMVQRLILTLWEVFFSKIKGLKFVELSCLDGVAKVCFKTNRAASRFFLSLFARKNLGLFGFIFGLCFSLILSASSKDVPKASDYDPIDDPIDRAYHGYYPAARIQIQEKIIETILQGLRPGVRPPEITFLTGPLASGKTTLAHLIQKGSPDSLSTVHIDIDRIRAMLPEFDTINAVDPKKAVAETQKEAGYVAELVLWRALKMGLNVIYETSLRQTVYMNNLKPKISAYAPNYRGKFNMIFVFADLPSLLEKAHFRNQKERRFTPPEDVKERYYTAMDNFFKIKSIFDHVVVIDNSKSVQRWVYYEEAPTDFAGRHQQGLTVPISQIGSLSFDYFKKQQELRPSNKGYDLFLDLDWTLFYRLQDTSECEPEKLISFRAKLQGQKDTVEYYRAADHIEKFFTEIKSLEDVRIRIITGASDERAKFLLSKVIISQGPYRGRSLLDLTSSVSSLPDLLQSSFDEKRPFTERFGKYVQKLFPDIDMTRTILMDDQVQFSRFGLATIDSFGRLNFRSHYQQERSHQKYEASSEEIFNFERNRLPYLLSAIVEAYQKDRAGSQRFSDIQIVNPWQEQPLLQERLRSPNPSRLSFASKLILCSEVLKSE